ncbi:phospholipid scramblase 4-like [Ptychodera flava]|uniref:phospholipid scramblase 4-like n=1 Tax=Ptychodera flava TaxID=63121 RepID=UPI003969E887
MPKYTESYTPRPLPPLPASYFSREGFPVSSSDDETIPTGHEKAEDVVTNQPCRREEQVDPSTDMPRQLQEPIGEDGLQTIKSAHKIFIKQIHTAAHSWSCDPPNRFKIFVDGRQLLYASDDCRMGKQRDVIVKDCANNRKVIRIRRKALTTFCGVGCCPTSCSLPFSSEMESPVGCVIGSICRRPSPCWRLKCDILNIEDNLILKLRSSRTGNFLQTPTSFDVTFEEGIANITHHWVKKSVFARPEDRTSKWELVLPVGARLQHKILILGAVFCLDFMFGEPYRHRTDIH